MTDQSAIEIGPTRLDEFEAILDITARAAVFNEEELATVEELLEGYAEGPEISGYNFLSYRVDGQVLGYACWGARELSGNGYDLYWISVDPTVHSKGIGRALMRSVEDAIRARNGVWLVIETSDTEHYAPARRLYERCGYTLAMYLPDFYKDGDGLYTYTRRLR